MIECTVTKLTRPNRITWNYNNKMLLLKQYENLTKFQFSNEFKNEMWLLLHGNNVKTTKKHSSKGERESQKNDNLNFHSSNASYRSSCTPKRKDMRAPHIIWKKISFLSWHVSPELIAGHIHPALIWSL